MANIQNMNLIIIIITTTFNQFLQALCHLIFIIMLQVSNYNYFILTNKKVRLKRLHKLAKIAQLISGKAGG